MIYTAASIMLVCASLTLAQVPDVDKAFAEFQRSWVTPDKSAADKLISDDLVWISVRGRTLDKQEVLKTWGGRGGMQTLQDKKVRVYGDAAVITFTDGEARRTIVWHKSRDGWMEGCVFSHLPDPAVGAIFVNRRQACVFPERGLPAASTRSANTSWT